LLSLACFILAGLLNVAVPPICHMAKRITFWLRFEEGSWTVGVPLI
jgi:hypothetical protein